MQDIFSVQTFSVFCCIADDPLGRLTNLPHRAPDNAILSSFAYTLDNADQRTRVTRANGFHIDYAYDPIGQLTGATEGKGVTH